MAEIIYGFHSVSPLVRQLAHQVTRLYHDKARIDRRMSELLNEARLRGVDIFAVDYEYLSKLCLSTKHQGIALELKQSLTSDGITLKDLLENIVDINQASLLMLDGVTDPHNLGAIIRTAECFGVNGIILPKNNSARINSTVMKSSAGAVNFMPIVIVNNLTQAISEIQKAGFWVAGTCLSDEAISLYQFDPLDKMLWVMGSEDQGIRHLVSENCDYLVSIPTVGKTESLNVSVATGVVLSYSQLKLGWTNRI